MGSAFDYDTGKADHAKKEHGEAMSDMFDQKGGTLLGTIRDFGQHM